MLTCPYFPKPFHIYTDASEKQLGAVITQDEKPIAFYGRHILIFWSPSILLDQQPTTRF
jgi:hypothetical protein